MNKGSAVMAASQNPAAASTTTSPANPALGKWYAAAGVASALASLVGGFSELSAGRDQAALYEEQARLKEEEGQRDAAQHARDVTHFQASQARKYLNAGVTLEGTPILMLEDTRRKGQEEVDSIKKRAEAEAKLDRMRGKAAKKSGRNAMFGSVLSSAGTGISTYLTMQRLGMFGAGNVKPGDSRTGDFPNINNNTDRYA